MSLAAFSHHAHIMSLIACPPRAIHIIQTLCASSRACINTIHTSHSGQRHPHHLRVMRLIATGGIQKIQTGEAPTPFRSRGHRHHSQIMSLTACSSSGIIHTIHTPDHQDSKVASPSSFPEAICTRELPCSGPGNSILERSRPLSAVNSGTRTS